MNRMKENIIMNAAKHMRDELVVGGVRQQQQEEDCIQVATDFFLSKMNVNVGEDEILEAERGRSVKTRIINGKSVEIPPVLFLKVSPHFARIATKYSWRLAGKKDPDGYGYYVHYNTPEGPRVIHTKYSPGVQNINEENLHLPPDKQRTYRFSFMKFFMDGKLVTPRVKPPCPKELLNRSTTLKAKMDSITFVQSEDCKEMGSVFRGFAAPLYSLDLVQPAYIKVRKQLKPTADSIFVAYRMVSPKGKIMQNSSDDGEFFGDLTIRDLLRDLRIVNVIVFVSRDYQGRHIGDARFRLVREAAKKALDQMQCDSEPKQQRPPCDRRVEGPPEPQHSLQPQEEPQSSVQLRQKYSGNYDSSAGGFHSDRYRNRQDSSQSSRGNYNNGYRPPRSSKWGNYRRGYDQRSNSHRYDETEVKQRHFASSRDDYRRDDYDDYNGSRRRNENTDWYNPRGQYNSPRRGGYNERYRAWEEHDID